MFVVVRCCLSCCVLFVADVCLSLCVVRRYALFCCSSLGLLGCALRVVRCLLSDVCCSLLIVRCLFDACYSLRAVCSSLFVAFCVLFAVCC